MKRSVIFFILLAGLFIEAGCSSIDESVYLKDRKMSCDTVKITVLPFKDAQGKPGSGTVVADAITNDLVKIDNWSMVERSQLSNIMKEKSLDATGMTTADLAQIARLTSTDYVIVGSVSQYYYGKKALIVSQTKLSFQGRIINVRTGDIAGTFSYDAETGKHAWCGCCLLGYYYIPVALLTDENITDDVRKAGSIISSKIRSRIRSDRTRCGS